MQITAYMLSCPEREALRQQTLANLQASDWPDLPRIELDQTTFARRQERLEQTALQLLRRAVAEASEFILLLEDDLQFNRHLRHNLEHWYPLRHLCRGEHFWGSLYNPNVRELERHEDQAFFVADPKYVYGSQAFVLSVATARYIVDHWGEAVGMQDIKMSRLAARLCSVYYHVPSLVQHIGVMSTWGGHYHWARDFDADWKAVPDYHRNAPETSAWDQTMLSTASILDHMRAVEGWLDDAEAELLIAAASRAVELTPERQAVSIVEVGSYCGKSTIVLGLTLKGLGQCDARVYAIDPHNGEVSGLNQTIMRLPPTFEKFLRNLEEAVVSEVVEPIRARSYEVVWDKPIALLFIDGLHDYASVAADFHHFAPWVLPGAHVAFHDYADYFFGVKRFVDEVVRAGEYQVTEQAGSLIVLQKKAKTVRH